MYGLCIWQLRDNRKSAEHGSSCVTVLQMSEVSYAFVTLISGRQKCLSHFRLSVLYNTNDFYFRTFITLFQKLLSLGFIHSKFSELIRGLTVFKKIKNALGCMNILLLDSNRRHVSVIHVPS